MNISEVLEMSTRKPIAEIARDHLTIGEKTARQALKRAGCYSIVGQPGWFLDESENPENLDKSIYLFAEQIKEERAALLKEAANVQTYKRPGPDVQRKRHSFDLDVKLVKKLKLKCVREDINLYEAVEEAINLYLQQNNEDEGNAL